MTYHHYGQDYTRQKQEKQNPKTVSFWQYFTNLIDVIRLNNKSIQKVAVKEQVMQKILKHDSNCLDQMICALNEGNQNNLLVIFNVKQVFESFMKTLKQVKSFVEGISRWIQAQKFNSERKTQKTAHKQKIINFQKNCCHYCQQVLQDVRIHQLSSQLNLSKQNRLNNLDKILKIQGYQYQQPLKFAINYSVMKKYPQAQNYISQVLIQEDKRLNQFQKYLKDHQNQTNYIKNQFNTSIIHDLLEELLKKIKQKLNKNSRVKYEDILNEFKQKLSLYYLQIEQKYLQKTKNISAIEGLFDKQKRVLIKVKQNQNDKKKTIVFQQSQFHQLILKKQIQISQKSKEVEYFKIQMEKYKLISLRLQKQLTIALDKYIKNSANKNIQNQKKQGQKIEKEKLDVQTQINQWQIIVVFNFLNKSQKAIQKVTNIRKNNKNQVFLVNSKNGKNINIDEKHHNMAQTYQQFAKIKDSQKYPYTYTIETKQMETQYQSQTHGQFGIYSQIQNCQEVQQKYKNSRRRSVPKILLMQNRRKSKDISGQVPSQILTQHNQIKEVAQQNSQKYLRIKTDEGSNQQQNNTRNEFDLKNDIKQHLKTKNKKKYTIDDKSTTRYKTIKKDKKSLFVQNGCQNIFLTNMKQQSEKRNANIHQFGQNQNQKCLELSQITGKGFNHKKLQSKNSSKKRNQISQLNQGKLQEINQNQLMMCTSFSQKPLNFLQSIEVKQFKKLAKLKQLKCMIFPKEKNNTFTKHRRYNTESASDLNSNNLNTTTFVKGNKKKNNFKKQILFNISDLQIFGGISQSFYHQNLNSKRFLSNPLQKSSKQNQGQCKSLGLSQKHELLDIQTKQTNRLYHYIMTLKQFRNAFYWNIISFVIKPYETVQQNQIVVQEKDQKYLKEKLQKLMAYHKKQCKSMICTHIKMFFVKIGFNSKIFP